MIQIQRRVVIGGLAALSGMALLSGCIKDQSAGAGNSTSTAGPTTSGQTSGGKVYNVGFSQANSKDPWRQAQNKSLDEAAKTYPDMHVTRQDAAGDSQTQIGQVETFLTQKVDILLISPNESAPLTPVVGKAFDAKIPVVIMDRNINSDKYTTWLGGDNTDIGKQAGQLVIEKSGGKGRIVEIWGIAATGATTERHQGFTDAIAKAPGLTVVDHLNCDFKRDAAQDYMDTVLQKHVDFNIIYAHNDEMALGAIQALTKAGKDPSKYIIVGIDGVQPEVVQAIQAGKMTATFKYPWLGKEAMDTAHDILTGKTVPKRIILPTEKVTKENADAYLAGLPK